MLSSDIHVFQFIRFTLYHNSNPTVGLASSIAHNTIPYVVCLMTVIDEYTQKGHHARSHEHYTDSQKYHNRNSIIVCFCRSSACMLGLQYKELQDPQVVRIPVLSAQLSSTIGAILQDTGRRQILSADEF